MYNKKYVIMVAVAILASVVAAMAYANSDGWKNRKQRDTVEIIADSSSFVESSNSSIVESSSAAESSSNAESSKIEDSSSLNESSLSESSETESSTEICNSENVQNENQISSDTVTYEVWDNKPSVGEPVQGKTYEPVEENKKSVGEAVVGYTEADVELLASLINHESSFSDEGRLMVGSVVVNRMNNTGDNLYDTIAAPGQFTSPWGLNYYTDADYEAAEYVLENGAINTEAYYFNGCHPDGLNWFTDYDGNWVGAY